MTTATLPMLNKPIRRLPQFLYLEPTSVCNLHCAMCYTNVINGADRKVLAAERILDFVARVVAVTDPPVSIYWCGTGEAFLHKDFPRMVNHILAEYGERVEQTIQTNGTLRRLDEFDSLTRLDFRVSIDGAREFHDWHRGEGTYDKIIDFCREAVQLGCRSLTIRALLTRDNIYSLDEFERDLKQRIGPAVKLLVSIAYTNRTLRLVRHIAPSINQQDIDDERALSRPEAQRLLEEHYQGRFELDETPEAVDNYLSLNPYGVHTCCHGILHIGEPETDLPTLLRRLEESELDCRDCALFPCQ